MFYKTLLTLNLLFQHDAVTQMDKRGKPFREITVYRILGSKRKNTIRYYFKGTLKAQVNLLC